MQQELLFENYSDYLFIGSFQLLNFARFTRFFYPLENFDNHKRKVDGF